MYKTVRVFCNQCEVLSHCSSSCSVPNNSDLNHEVARVLRGGGAQNGTLGAGSASTHMNDAMADVCSMAMEEDKHRLGNMLVQRTLWEYVLHQWRMEI